MRKAILVAMAVLLVATLTACSQQVPTEDPGTGDTQPEETPETGETGETADNTSDVENTVEDELISENDSVEVGEMV